MSKKHYVVNCYTCQHNGQETCNGCRTLLVGEDEPYENWQLREDLEQKDQRIAELEDKWNKIKVSIFDRCEFYNDLVEDGSATECSKGKQYLLNEIYDEMQELENGEKR